MILSAILLMILSLQNSEMECWTNNVDYKLHHGKQFSHENRIKPFYRLLEERKISKPPVNLVMAQKCNLRKEIVTISGEARKGKNGRPFRRCSIPVFFQYVNNPSPKMDA